MTRAGAKTRYHGCLSERLGKRDTNLLRIYSSFSMALGLFPGYGAFNGRGRQSQLGTIV
jgi:hypothetical protein